MVERLSNLAYLSNNIPSNQPHGNGNEGGYSHAPTFNPRSVSFDIHTPEELVAVNEFLITLGREVTMTTRAHPVPPRHSAREFDNHPNHSYFNPTGLNELGLTGMPGILNSGAGPGVSFNDAAMYSTSSATGFPPYPSRSIHQSVSVPGINFPMSLTTITRRKLLLCSSLTRHNSTFSSSSSPPTPSPSTSTPETKTAPTQLSPEKMWALISLYHQSKDFISPANLSDRIDKVFAKDFYVNSSMFTGYNSLASMTAERKAAPAVGNAQTKEQIATRT